VKQHEVIDVWEKNLPKLEKEFVNFPWEDERSYGNYLAQTYRYIIHSCKLLRYAAQKTEHSDLKKCLLHHDAEEDGHENLALNDLKKMGFSLEDFPELKETKVIYDTIYDQIDQYGPAAIIGYAMALEGLSARRCPEISQRLVEKWGRKKASLICLHGEVDPGHMEESFETLNFFTEDELDVVGKVILESIDRYISYLKSVQQYALAAA